MTNTLNENSIKNLWQLGVDSIKELETQRGILASGREEVFGCIFGRDSLLTGLSLLSVFQKTGDRYFLELVSKIIWNLCELQGREINIESGEEPGKCIHEFMPDNHAHLTSKGERPWYLYPDNMMRNYDSVDATPLFLIAVYKYWKVSGDSEFLAKIFPYVQASILWVLNLGDDNRDGFIDYKFHPERKYGGLTTQSWMDSGESVFFEHSFEIPKYPIAPVEVQAYTYAALLDWAQYFSESNPLFGELLMNRALNLKRKFNEKFVIKKNGNVSLAFGLDGAGRQLESPRSSMAHCLWAVAERDDGTTEGILDERYVDGVVARLLKKDLLTRAGIRTLSSRSSHFDPTSYHNGSIWPHDNAILAEGLENFGFLAEAKQVKENLLVMYKYFETPIELFVYKRGRYKEYVSESGQRACRKQAWSAASLLTTLSNYPVI